jgi:glycosyltransferase involved in cell wall biosynthesis
MAADKRVAKFAVAYAVAPGVQGGLGHHAAEVMDACARAWPNVTAFGPVGPDRTISGVSNVAPPALTSAWSQRWTWRRYLQGAGQLEADRAFGRWLSEQAGSEFRGCYLFTQIALELLRELRQRGTPHLLDNPNGHIRHFRDVVQREAEKWLPTRYPGHPTAGMVDRVEEEYALASRIRVGSTWAADSMVAHGVERTGISVVPHSVDLVRFVPTSPSTRTTPKLRVVFVGSLSLGKGFPYLLEAVRALGSDRIGVQIVGATGDPWCRRLFDRLRQGLDVTVAPGDPLPAYRQADLLVLPTLHDGFGYVVAEAMACGLPVITTDACGAAEWLRHGNTGWVVPSGVVDPLTAALDEAMRRQSELRDMGAEARRTIESVAGPRVRDELIRLILDQATAAAPAMSNELMGAGR